MCVCVCTCPSPFVNLHSLPPSPDGDPRHPLPSPALDGDPRHPLPSPALDGDPRHPLFPPALDGDPRVGSSKSPSPSRKKKGSGIPRRYLLDLVQRCGALLVVEEFVQEEMVLNLEEIHIEEGLDDGFGVYEIIAEDDPLDEEDCEIEDAAEMYASGMKKFDEPTSAVDEPTKEPWFRETKVNSFLTRTRSRGKGEASL
ncbi:hypothetical protein Taro_004893 [Colocasia esculenta]|uniref:Uncharacterized protein n=1 Tax=Colocasia esculenta TaxID=4460 RepID=A0A843TLI5_COLES|nr:hypothetical protein [Colocasia esculenta]